MKKLLALFLASFMLLATACESDENSKETGEVSPEIEKSVEIFEGIDFETSEYKHITNGGITTDDVLPYAIDAITGATVTVEGPAVDTSIPLSVRELENKNEGIVRGIYSDSTGEFIYEGVDLYYIINEMTDGDNGIFLTDNAYAVELRNDERATIATIKIEDITKAHENNEPIIIAYGIGTVDGEISSPFVYDGETEEAVPLGYIEELNNDDGCLKLVFDGNKYSTENNYTTFDNVAYIYIQEEVTPGFKHTLADNESYDSSDYLDYILTIRGGALGREFTMTLEELENLVKYDENNDVIEGGIGFRERYSLANNAYWYVNEYEGLDLYKMLTYLGMRTAEDMGRADSRNTLISFIAADGHPSNETFSVETLSYPDVFGFYQKNALDTGDGSYAPSNSDLVNSGYPVLLAYGVNSYPYTISTFDNGYLSGLGNSGGPFRIVFGKTQYYHANGSYQVQFVNEIIAGENIQYNTHKYSDNADYNALSNNTISLNITNWKEETIANENISVGEIEDIIYGENVDFKVAQTAKVKDIYEVEELDIYEGVDLEYFLMEYAKVPGTVGTVTFTSENGEVLTTDIDRIFGLGKNTSDGEEVKAELSPILAFAKNGSPLVIDENSAGYEGEVSLNPLSDSDPTTYSVNNSGGPLAVILPKTTTENAEFLANVVSINVTIEMDTYSHLEAPYDSLSKSEVSFYGEGLEKEMTYTVAEIEAMQIDAKTYDYSVVNSENANSYEERYRGVPLYNILTDIGLMSNAGDVIVHYGNGETKTISLSLLKGQNYQNYISPDKGNISAMLAFGIGQTDETAKYGYPLVQDENSDGFFGEIGNLGGPLKLVVPQEDESAINGELFCENVTAIEVTANDIQTWGHEMSDIYAEFLDYEFEFVVKNEVHEWRETFTVAQLEALTGYIVRDTYSVLEIGECEGVDIWNFVNLIAGEVEGIENPVSVTVYAEDGYKNDLLSTYNLEALEEGVLDANNERKALIIAYALNGYPLVDSENHEGYTGLAGNSSGPLRVIAENVQGASVKLFNKLIVTIEGDEEINITVDESIFEK